MDTETFYHTCAELSSHLSSDAEQQASGVYIIEKLVGRRGSGKSRRYRVKWQGFPGSENTWEPYSRLAHCSALIEDFEREFKKKKRPGKRAKRINRNQTRKDVDARKMDNSEASTETADEFSETGSSVSAKKLPPMPPSCCSLPALESADPLTESRLGSPAFSDTSSFGTVYENDVLLQQLRDMAPRVNRIAGLAVDQETGLMEAVLDVEGSDDLAEFPLWAVQKVFPMFLDEFYDLCDSVNC